MKILILDGFTLFQKDLDVSVFENYGEIIFRARTSRDELKQVDHSVDVIITNKCPIGADDLDEEGAAHTLGAVIKSRDDMDYAKVNLKDIVAGV